MIENFTKHDNKANPNSLNKLHPLCSNASTSKASQQFILSFLQNDETPSPNQNSQSENQEGKSIRGKMIEKLQKRKCVLINLKNLLQGQQSKGNLNNSIISEIAQLLSELRHCNLIIAETLINAYRQFKDNTPKQCKQLLLELNSDNDFLKRSILNKFIVFHDKYDPFLLYYQQNKNKEQPQLKHPMIERVFHLDITQTSRLKKAQRVASKLLKLVETDHPVVFKRRSHSYQTSKMTNIAVGKLSDNEEADFKRSTSTNFKIRALSNQKVNQIALRSINPSIRHSIIKHEKFQIINDPHQDDESIEESPKIISFNHKMKHFPYSRFKTNNQVNQQFIQTKTNSFNFKEKLAPIQKVQHISQAEGANNNQTITLNMTNQRFYQRHLDQDLKADDEESELKSTNDSQIKEIKMRAGKHSLGNLQEYLKTYSISQDIAKQVSINNYSVSVTFSQSYFSQLLINGDVKAVGVSIALPDGDYLIRMWAPFHTCSQNNSKLLFSKYLEYLQKQTMCNKIYYSGPYDKLASSFQFVPVKDKLYARNRLSTKKVKDLQFPQFLSLKCSNIRFPQENQTVSLLYSDQIQSFNERNYYIEPAVAAIDRQAMSQQILLMSKISDQISDMRALNSLLQDEQLDTFEITSSMSISKISALRLASNICFATPFVAGEGYFKFKGGESYRKDRSVICRIEGIDRNFSVLVGKGFSSIHNFIKNTNGQAKKQCEFRVKMFSKQLYGRMVNNSTSCCSYGNWELSLSLKDELQGRVKHNMSALESFGPESFYFAIQMYSKIIFCFEVGGDDFLY